MTSIKAIKTYLPLLLTSGLVACVSTSPPVKTIEKITISYNNGTVSPEYQKSGSLVVNGDLTTQWIGHDNRGRHERSGRITAAQLDLLKQKIDASNYMHVKVEEFEVPLLGGSSRSLTITTDLGSRSFSDGYRGKFPAKIADIYSETKKLTP